VGPYDGRRTTAAIMIDRCEKSHRAENLSSCVMFVRSRWFTSAQMYFRNSTYFLQNKIVLGVNLVDSLKFRRHARPPPPYFFLFVNRPDLDIIDRSKSGLNRLDQFWESLIGYTLCVWRSVTRHDTFTPNHKEISCLTFRLLVWDGYLTTDMT